MDNKEALEAEIEKAILESQFFETRNSELLVKICKNQTCEFESSDSLSDSYLLLNNYPPLSQLKTVQKYLQTCASQELTGIDVLQSEEILLMEAPQYVRGSKVKQPGSWYEVTAACYIDLVPFSIHFYTHMQDTLFTPTYHGLSVILAKKGQQMELSKSVLSDIDKPSDAVEFLKSYSKAYRARRTILASLADQYPDEIRKERLAEGGYLLICGSVMRLTWQLENEWSSLSPHRHKIIFHFKNMDEAHLKIISEAVETTSLDKPGCTKILSEIISTCLLKKLKSSCDTNILPISLRNPPSKSKSSSDPNVLGKMAKTQTNLRKSSISTCLL